MQSIKEDYLIAKGGKANPYIILRFFEVQLVLMSPIIPHFTQYCWSKYVYPVFKDSENYPFPTTENLTK
jgi:leucyl-tRNA synthetase